MRLQNDKYFTPTGIVHALLSKVSVPVGCLVFEPCVGDGAIASCLKNDGHDSLLWTGDIDPLSPNDYKFDATDTKQWGKLFPCLKADWVVTNPPYKQPDCDAIIQNAWRFTNKGIAMLLRLSYLEPCKGRAKFLKEAPLSHLIIFNPRPQFIPGKKSTDSSTVAWFVWQKEWTKGTQVIYCTDWNE